jgi:23S rRNA (uracil1939-C5)-methyltransferase
MTCRHAGACGGCSLLHLTYSQQLTHKAEALLRLLRPHVPGLRSEGLFLPVGDNHPPTAFRQKVAFVFGRSSSGPGLVMGHYERGSQRIVPVAECPVHSARGNRIAFALRDHLGRGRITAAGADLSGVLRHVLVRTTADDRQAVAMLVVTRNDKALRRPVRAFLESADAPDGFFINVHDRPGPFMVGDETLKIAGHAHVREVVGGITYQISPTAFFQTNVQAASVLQAHVVQSVSGARRVLDLYCGSGLFSLPLARGGAFVTGIEENRQAVRDAESNAQLNGIAGSRTRFLAGRSEALLRPLSRDRWDAVILDPPRQGCDPAVLHEVFGVIAPGQVTYVSCNPEALAAELPAIRSLGYRARSAHAVDMFPHTDHLEVVMTFVPERG